MSRRNTRAEKRRAQRSRTHAQRSGSHDRRTRGPSTTQLAIAGVVAVLAVAAVIVFGNVSSPPLSSGSASIAQSSHALGQPSAPVTIEEWADFQCPACGMFARDTEPPLISSYVGKGQVRLVFHHFAFLGNESQWAAEAAECADDQGKFWDFHNRLYASQAGENRGAFSKDNLKKIGNSLGLGADFASCVDSGRYAQRVLDDTNAGKARGVSVTPTLFVNGRKIEGAISFDKLKTVIDPLLVASR